MKFFTYSQNNSGRHPAARHRHRHRHWQRRRFIGPAQYVIVQADDADQADSLAQDAGLYFNGVNNGQDCDCCGDRWHKQWGDDDCTDTPMIYGTPVTDYRSDFGADGQPIAIVIYKDGTTVTYHSCGISRRSYLA